MPKKQTEIKINDLTIPITQVLCRDITLYVDLQEQKIRGVYPFHVTQEYMEEVCFDKTDELKNILQLAKGWKFNNPFKYEDGEVEYIIGEYYKLKVKVNPSVRQNVLMDSENHLITLTVCRPQNTKDFFDKHMRLKLAEYVQSVIPELEKELGVKSQGFKIKKLRKAYGNCNKDGFMNFSPLLYRKSKESVKEVVLHELCHIKEFNHKGEFFDLMSSVMPDWKKWDAELKQVFPEIKIIV